MAKVLLGERPERPNHLALTDELWALAQQCLNGDPRQRPEIAEVVCCLQRALAVRRSATHAETSKKGTLHSVFHPFRRISHGLQHRESKSSGSRGGVQSTSRAPRNLLKKARVWLQDFRTPSQDGSLSYHPGEDPASVWSHTKVRFCTTAHG